MRDVGDLWFMAPDIKKERWLARLPQCEYCGEHIQDEYFYEINGEWICKACLDDEFKRENTLLEDDE